MNKTVKIILTVLALLVIAFFAFRAYTKSKSPAEILNVNENGHVMKVEYCRPYAKNRKIFGGLVPYGKVWRTGANEATIFETNKDIKLGDKTLKAGKYSLWTIPNADKWTMVFNSETGQWGTNHDDTKDVLKVDIPTKVLPQAVEQFKINLTPAEMILQWENTEARLPISL